MKKKSLKKQLRKRVVAHVLILGMILGMIPGSSFVANAVEAADADAVANQLSLLDFNMHAATLENGREYNGQYSGTSLDGKEIVLKISADARQIVSGNGAEIKVGTPNNANRSGFYLEINKDNCLDVRNMIGVYSKDENSTCGARIGMNQSLTDLGIAPGQEFELRMKISFLDSDNDGQKDDIKLNVYVNDTEIYPNQLIVPNQVANFGTYMGFSAPQGTKISFAPVYKAPLISVGDFTGQVFTPYKAAVGSHSVNTSAIGTYSATSLVGTRFRANVTPIVTSTSKPGQLYFAGKSDSGWDGFWVRFRSTSDNKFLLEVFDRMVNTQSGSAITSINLTELGIASGDTFLLELQLDLIANGEDGVKDDARLTVRVEDQKQCVAIVDGASSKLGNKMFFFAEIGNTFTFEKVLAKDETVALNETGKRLKLHGKSTPIDIQLSGTDSAPSGGWNLNTYSYSGTDSGIYYNGVLNTKISFRKIDGMWRMFLTDGEITAPASGDKITIRGSFRTHTQTYAVDFSETTLVFDGIAWNQTHTESVEKNVLLFQYAPNVDRSVYLTGLDNAPYDTNWATNIYRVNGSEHGVFLKKAGETSFTRTDAFLRKVSENRWVVCLYDWDTTYVHSVGDVVKLKGQFSVGDYVIEFREILMTWNGTSWSWSTEGTGVAGDANADNVTDVKDIIRMKRYMTYENVSMDDADLNSDSKIDSYDVSLLKEILIGKSVFSGGANFSLPDYSLSDDIISLGAFAGPRKAGYEYWGGEENFYRNTSYVTDEGFADYAATGLNFVFSEHDGFYENTEEFQTYMQAAANNNVDVYVSSSTLTKMLRGETGYSEATLSSIINNCKKYKNFKGFMMADEPRHNILENYQKIGSFIRGKAPELKLYTSGYPMYVSSKAFSDDETAPLKETYTAYMDKLGNALGNFAYDFYPFQKVVNASGTTTNRTVRSQWFENLEIAASTARGKYDTGITIQSHSTVDQGALNAHKEFTSYRELTKSDISFQVYSALAYGMKQIVYYTYWEHPHQAMVDYYTDAMIMWDQYNSSDSQPVKTDLYYAVQAVNQEILSFDHVFLNFNWQGTMVHKQTDADGMLAKISNYSSPRVQSFTGNNDVIMGCMKDKQAHDGFMLVNATDPYDNKTAQGSVIFKNATHALVYINGVQKTVTLTNGKYDYKLSPGEGVFVIPYLADWKDSIDVHGRCVEQVDGSLGLFWTNSGVTFRFDGTGATAVIASSNVREGAQGYLNVYVDGSLEPTKTICLTQTEGTYVLAENLQAGEHTIEVRKRNEAAYGGSATLTLKNVAITGGDFLLCNQKSNYRIEVIGDSVTSGYGNMVTDGLGGYTSATTDGTKTYAVLAAKQLGAEVSIVSRSGIAYCRDLDRHDSMYNYYTKMARLPEGNCGNQDWNFQTNPSDVVVINLGSNDNVATRDGIKITDAYMTAEGVEFLELVREKNPDAIIIWAYGMYEESRSQAIQAAVTQRNNAGDDKVYYLQLKQANEATEGLGAHLHPSIKTNIDRSITLAEFIAEKTGWSVQTQVRDYYRSQITN